MIAENSYDFIFIINCEMATEEVLRIYKSHFKTAKFYLYLNDSISNIYNISCKFKYFDKIFSFDRIDCLNNIMFIFRPLFYIDEYDVALSVNKPYKYDLCFIGTIHSDRFAILDSIKHQANTSGFTFYIFPYLQARFMYFFYKIANNSFANAHFRDFKYSKISVDEIIKVVNNSSTIVDIQHPKQTGLTIRTIEMLAMKKKIITTNMDIKNYDFFHTNNIYIINRDKPYIDISFLKKEYIDLDLNILHKYSLKQWILDILDN